jgi:cytochrome c-type biogenesis protein CcmH/NrfG
METGMSARARREKSYEEEPPYTWIPIALSMLLVGGLGGYVLSVTAQRGAASAPPALTQGTSGTVIDENALGAYRDMLARDPRNLQAAISAGNLLYDAKRYSESVPFYQQALAIDPRNVNVSTDLGTAFWYSGRPDEALAQFARSLEINPTHEQTLFNLGIVKSDGKADYAGAVAAWERLLATHPGYPNASNVRRMIAEARTRAGT